MDEGQAVLSVREVVVRRVHRVQHRPIGDYASLNAVLTVPICLGVSAKLSAGMHVETSGNKY